MPITIKIRAESPILNPNFIKVFRRKLNNNIYEGFKKVLLPRMRAITPIDTGRLRDALNVTRRRPNITAIGFNRRGFYWYFQVGLPDELDRVLERSLRPVLYAAARKAWRDAGRDVAPGVIQG